MYICVCTDHPYLTMFEFQENNNDRNNNGDDDSDSGSVTPKMMLALSQRGRRQPAAYTESSKELVECLLIARSI